MNIDLTKILKNCPKGTKLYSIVHGEVSLIRSNDGLNYPIVVKLSNKAEERFTAKGKLFVNYNGECVLFPSREQRDWSKFTAPWYKKEKASLQTIEDKKLKNKVRFYVARDRSNNTLYIYLSKPRRDISKFYPSTNGSIIAIQDYFYKFGLNEKDFDNLKFEDEPVEVFLNLEN